VTEITAEIDLTTAAGAVTDYPLRNVRREELRDTPSPESDDC
jgi:hypothetical protein